MIRTRLATSFMLVCCIVFGSGEVTTVGKEIVSRAATTESPQLVSGAAKIALASKLVSVGAKSTAPQLVSNGAKTTPPQLVSAGSNTKVSQLISQGTNTTASQLISKGAKTAVTTQFASGSAKKGSTAKFVSGRTKAAVTTQSTHVTSTTSRSTASKTSHNINAKVSESPPGNRNQSNISSTLGNILGALNSTNITNVIGTLLGDLSKTNVSKGIENLFSALNNKNVTNALGNATEAFGKLLAGVNGNGMGEIFKTIEGLLGNGTTMTGISKNIEQLLGNGKGMAGIAGTIGQLLGNGSNIGGIVNTIEGLVRVTNGSDIAKFIEGLLGNMNGNDTGKSPPLGPLQTNSALGKLATLLPSVIGTYLTPALKALGEKNISNECMNDLYLWTDGLQSFQGWAWKLIDAGFKLPSNLAGFNLMSMGDMGECLAIHANTFNKYTKQTKDFDGKYCRLLIPVTVPNVGSQAVVLGSCASSRCSNDDVKIIVDSAIGAILPKMPIEAQVSCVEDMKLDSKAIAVICFLAILGSVVVAATIYDVLAFQRRSRDDDQNSYSLNDGAIKMTSIHSNGAYTVTEVESGPLPVKQDLGKTNSNGVMHNANFSTTKRKVQGQGRLVKAILAFSAYSNARKLLGTSQASGSLSAINGIRFLSMAWVILGHTYFFAMYYTSNMFDFMHTKTNQYLFSAIINATPSVDSFFALSGCLVAYLTLREMKKVGGVRKLNWAMFYFHRFWRLTPPYMLILLVGTLLYKYIGNGALHPRDDSMFMHSCRDTWWTNLLYVNNFVKTDESCMGWSWYLANDMQMYVLSPLILVPFYFNKFFGGIVSAIILISTIVTTGVIAHNHEYPVQSFSRYAPTKQDEHYMQSMYYPVYTRIGPYIVGLITGYILYKCNCKCRIPKWLNFCCWFVCILFTTLIIYGPYTYEGKHIMSTNESTAFFALFRTGFGMAVCWVIFACATGNGGFVNDLLSWSPYVPLGRLTYCAYLLHPLIMMKYYENRMQPIYFTDYDTVYFFIGNLVLSYGAAFVTSLFFESPMMGLEKAIFKK